MTPQDVIDQINSGDLVIEGGYAHPVDGGKTVSMLLLGAGGGGGGDEPVAVTSPTVYHPFNTDGVDAMGTGNDYTEITLVSGGKFGNCVTRQIAAELTNNITTQDADGVYSWSVWYRRALSAIGRVRIGSSDSSVGLRVDLDNAVIINLDGVQVLSHVISSPPNEWNHFAITMNNGTLKLYENGSEVAEASVSSATVFDNSHILGVAVGTSTNRKFFDDVAFWDGYVLTPAEISTIAAGSAPLSDLI